ncbi:MAG: hypothetical protein O7C67_06415 [Gammaproteobacteria bacterium]|nr:hypothetical protein [Gammaproteobacteria bacterium]
MTQEKLWDYFQVEDDSESNVFGASNARNKYLAIGRRHFADPARLNWKGKVVWIAKSLLLALKIPGKNDNFFFLSQ